MEVERLQTARAQGWTGISPERGELLRLAVECVHTLDSLLAEAQSGLRHITCVDGRVSGKQLEGNQYAVHAFAWLATYVECLRQMLAWAQDLDRSGQFGSEEQLILQVAFGEYLSQIFGGIVMSQGEIARLQDMGIEPHVAAKFSTASVQAMMAHGNNAQARNELSRFILANPGRSSIGATGLDEDMEEVRSQIRRFTDEKVVPYAQGWHIGNELIPIGLIAELAEMGIFGLTIPEHYDGSAMSKSAMCVVSEELARGYLGVGSLATRSEIAAELVQCGGTEEQKDKWLPGLATGEILPTAVFTEPGTGSDLGALRTRAVADGDVYQVTGSKTWITHAARANVMTLLARTDLDSRDYRGLSMFLAEKTPGTDSDPFPDGGISGTEIDVIGYRGMKEFEIGFDGFEVARENLLGGEEGNGFRQLMETFESARIQTAARAIGVAQSAFEAGLQYSIERKQFGKPIIEFPRISSKLAMMATEIMIARQLTYYAARQKDSGRRCDLEAGMAKLLAARVAWAAADNTVQIHGGNGFAVEYPASRILCDARLLSIFEGAAEIQATVIARRLLDPRAN